MSMNECKVEIRERSLQHRDSLVSNLLDHDNTFRLTSEQEAETEKIELLDRPLPWFVPICALLQIVEKSGEIWIFPPDGAKGIFRRWISE